MSSLKEENFRRQRMTVSALENNDECGKHVFSMPPVYHRDSRQEFAKVGGIFPILHVVFLLDASN